MKLPSMRANEDQNYTPEMNGLDLDFFFEGFLLTWILSVSSISLEVLALPPLTNVRKKSFRTKTPDQRKSISLPRLFNLSAKLELLGLK